MTGIAALSVGFVMRSFASRSHRTKEIELVRRVDRPEMRASHSRAAARHLVAARAQALKVPVMPNGLDLDHVSDHAMRRRLADLRLAAVAEAG